MKKINKILVFLQQSFTLLLIFLALVSFVTASIEGSKNLGTNQEQETTNQFLIQDSNPLPYHELPIYGNASLGYYYVKIFVGSPIPQSQSVIIDTGSGLLAVPGADCKKCSRKHIDPPYDPTKSQSSHQLTCSSGSKACEKNCKNKNGNDPCKFSIYYAEGSSLEGSVVEDDIRFETYSKDEQIRTSFGYTDKETNYFLTQKANGIFGLAPKRENDLLQKMVEKHSPWSKQKLRFSLCLSSDGGIMTIGGLNQKLHKNHQAPNIIIPYQDRQNLYSLNGVKEISIQEQLIHLPGDKAGTYGIFIDSGSTFSYFPKARFHILETKLNKTCINSGRCEVGRGQDSTCFKLKLNPDQTLSDAVQDLFPPIQFYIMDKKVYWNPTKYLLVRELKNNEVCLGILGLDRYLLGANWMYDRDIVFDLQNKNIELYDNVNCKETSSSMGRYLSDEQIKGSISFQHETQIRINMESYMFWIGVFSLILALIILVMLKCGACEQKQRTKASSLNEGTQFQIIRTSQE